MQNSDPSAPNSGAEPNYSFLQEYEAPQPKRSPKKIILIVAGLIFIASIIAAVVASGGNSNKPQTPVATERTIEQPSSLFMRAVQQKNKQATYDRLGPGVQQAYTSAEAFDSEIGSPLRKTMNEYSCASQPVSEGTKRSLVYKCEADSAVFWIGFGVENIGQESEVVYTLCPIDTKEMVVCQ